MSIAKRVLAAGVLAYGDNDWLILLIVLTLPWSAVSLVFMWSLMHGASLGFFWVLYLGGGAVNAFMFYRYLPRLSRSWRSSN